MHRQRKLTPAIRPASRSGPAARAAIRAPAGPGAVLPADQREGLTLQRPAAQLNLAVPKFRECGAPSARLQPLLWCAIGAQCPRQCGRQRTEPREAAPGPIHAIMHGRGKRSTQEPSWRNLP